MTETPSTGHLNAGDTVTFTLNLNEVVTVAGGTPTLTLNDGGVATYTGGSGSNALTFSYTVAAGQNTASLAATAVNLNSATITDGAGNAANLSLSGLTQSGPQIDTTTPTIASLTETPATGDLNAGKTAALTLNLNEAVTVTGGTPTLSLNDGGVATYTSGSGSKALTFSYSVAAGQNTAALTTTAINLNSATIADGAGNVVNLSLTGLSQSGPQIDTTPPPAPIITFDKLVDKRLVLSGTEAQSGTTISIYDGTTLLGTTMTGTKGTWVYTTGPLANGDVFTATATDGAGNISAASSPYDPNIGVPSLNVVTLADATATQVLSLSSLITISDPGSLGYQQLELWDSKGTLAGGQFVVNGVPQTGGHEIDVSPANVANTVFDAGTAGGTDTLWARLLQNDGSLTQWQQFNVTVPQPTLNVTGIGSGIGGEVLNLSSLATIADPGSVGYQQLELWDSKGTLAGGQFVVNGVPQTGGHEIDVSPANVANTVFDAGTAGGTDTLWARLLQNDGSLTQWQQFNVTVPQPTLNVTGIGSGIGGEVLNLSSLATIADPGSVGYQQLELWDSKGTLAGGQFVVNGVPQTGGHEIDVSPANVANTVFDAGTAGGTDTLWARLLQNDGSLTSWQQFNVTVPQPTLNVTGIGSGIGGEVLNLSSLATIADPGSVGYQQLELWDSKGTLAGGQFVVNGVPQTGGHEIDVSPANVANTVFDAGTAGGTDTLWARLLQNDGSLTPWQQFTVTVPQPTLNVTGIGSGIGGQVLNLSSLATIADPGFVGYQQLELWDSKGTLAGGQFVVNGVPQTGGHEIDVSPANVANTVFDAGTAGGTDTLWARLLQNNGNLTAWQQFTVTVPSADVERDQRRRCD